MFTSGANIVVVGINITTQVKFTGGVVIPVGTDFYATLSYLLLNVILGQTLESEHCLLFSDADLLELKESKGKHAPLLSDMCKFYRDWHVKSDGVYGNFTYYFDLASYAVRVYIFSQLLKTSKLAWE